MNRVKLVEKEKGALEVSFFFFSFLSAPPSGVVFGFPLVHTHTRREREKGTEIADCWNTFWERQSRKKDADSYLRDQLELVSLQNQLYQRNAHQAQADKVEVERRAHAAHDALEEEMGKQKHDREKYVEDQAYYEQQKAECKVSLLS